MGRREDKEGGEEGEKGGRKCRLYIPLYGYNVFQFPNSKMASLQSSVTGWAPTHFGIGTESCTLCCSSSSSGWKSLFAHMTPVWPSNDSFDHWTAMVVLMMAGLHVLAQLWTGCDLSSH